jgi:hypothetical protein
MAFETLVGEDRADIKIIADFSSCTAGIGRAGGCVLRSCTAGFVVETGSKKDDSSYGKGRYGSNVADGDRFRLKLEKKDWFGYKSPDLGYGAFSLGSDLCGINS